MDKKTPQEGPNSPIVSSRRAKRRKIAKKKAASLEKETTGLSCRLPSSSVGSLADKPESVHSSQTAEQDICFVCNSSVKKRKGHAYPATTEIVQFFKSKDLILAVEQQICRKCYEEYRKSCHERQDEGEKKEFADENAEKKRTAKDETSHDTFLRAEGTVSKAADSADRSLVKIQDPKCPVCNVFLKNRKGHPYRATSAIIDFYKCKNVIIEADDMICMKCYKQFTVNERGSKEQELKGEGEKKEHEEKKTKKEKQLVEGKTSSDLFSEPQVNLPESSATHSLDEAKESNCSICNTRLRRAKGHPYRVTEEMIRFFATENIFLNADNFICEKDYKRFHKSSKKATDGKSKFEFEEEEETEKKEQQTLQSDNPSLSSHDPDDIFKEPVCSVPLPIPQEYRCYACQSRIARTKGHVYYATEETVSFFASQNVNIKVNNRICRNCYVKYRKSLKLPSGDTEKQAEKRQVSQQDEPTTIDSHSSNPDSEVSGLQSSEIPSQPSSFSDPTVTFSSSEEIIPEDAIEKNIPRAIATHRCCMVCKSTLFKEKKIAVVPEGARLYAFTKQNLYIPKGNRICADHMRNDIILGDCLRRIHIASDTAEIPLSDYEKFFNQLIKNKDSFFDRLKDLRLSEKEFSDVIGMSKENFLDFAEKLTLKSSQGRNKYQALGVFLARMRHNMPQTLLARLFGIENQQSVSSYCKTILKALSPLLHSKFGPSTVTREDIINNHTTEIAKTLFGKDKVILIFDATYNYTNKSSNFWFQRASYSMQKKKNLVKPFTVCTTTGFIIDFFGPFEATWNDAKILKHLLETNPHLKELLREGIAILDRGFRDVVPYLKELGITVKMPSLKGKRAQFSTKEANMSRLVTKVRWAIEAIHGIVKKKFKFLATVRDTIEIPNMGKYFRVAGLLQNFYGKPLSSDEDDVKIAQKMLELVNNENELFSFLEKNNLLRKESNFISLPADGLYNFPVLTKEEIQELLTGSYQLKMAASYLAEFLNEKRTPLILMYKDEDILKIKMQSRHSKNKKYSLFIRYEPHENSLEGILGYYCSCANGLRTIGCCCHVSAIIFYLSYAVYTENIVSPASFLQNVFEENDVPAVLDDDSEDEASEDETNNEESQDE